MRWKFLSVKRQVEKKVANTNDGGFITIIIKKTYKKFIRIMEQPNPKKTKGNHFKIVLSLFILIGCDNASKQEHKHIEAEVVCPTYVLPVSTIDSLIYASIEFNDTISYSKISTYFISNEIGGQFFRTAFQMANKNKYSEAYYNMYEILVDRNSKTESLQKLDDKTRYFAMYCLLKSKEFGYHWCEFDIKEIFLNEKPPSSDFYLRKYCDY
jgi:hypothetical protein